MTYRHRTNLGVLLLVACVLSLTLTFMVLHATGPSDGARLEPDGPVWSRTGVEVAPFDHHPVGGLQQSDIVVAVAGRSVEEWAHLLVDPGATRPHWRVGDIVTYTVLRAGQQINLPVTLHPYPIGAVLRDEWGSLVFALVFVFIAAFVFLRRPADPAARALFLAASCLLSAQTWSFGVQISDLVDPIGFWLYQITALGVYTLFWTSLLHFALLFPRPHPLVTRWRWLVPAMYVSPAVYWVAYLIATYTVSHDTLEWIGTWTPGQGVNAIIYFAAALLIILDSFRINRDPITSRQIRWVVFAGALSGGAGLILSILPGDVLGHAIISTNVLGLVLLPIPLALAYAILRYRLFDIDIIINRALVYGTLTTTLALVYAISVVTLQTVAGRLSGLTTQWPPAIVASTLLIATLFQPLRKRLQAGIDRRFYRHKYDAARTLDAFGATMRAQTELEQLSERLVDVVEETMQPAHVSLWLAGPRRAPADRSSTSSAAEERPK